MRHRTPILTAVVLLTGISAAVAQQSMDGPYVLHEYVAGIDDSAASGEAQPSPARPAGPGLPPSLSLETRPGEPIYAEDGPVFEKDIEEPYGSLSPFGGSNELDGNTDRVDSLTYYSNFNPSVIPYKRVVAQNRVVVGPDGEYSVQLRAGEHEPVELAAEADPSMDVFWGTFLLRLEPNQLQPVASVSPDQRILQLETEPDVAITVLEDRADNFYVRSNVGGLVRVNMRVAAPKYYFNGEFTPVSWEQFPTGLVPPMAPGLKRRASALAGRVGFDQSRPPQDVLREMIRYFRDFDARPLPDELLKRDRLEAIVENQLGVCRHRSLAFIAIAQSLGIPSRYVYNEAHAFVEVFWPGQGWRRVDLGGAADELNASANEGSSVHDPGTDRLPTPQRYRDEQERMARNGWEAPRLGGSDSPGETGDNGESGENGKTGDSSSGTNGAAQPQASTNGSPSAVESPGENAPSSDGAESPAMFSEPPPDDRAETRLAIEQATAVVRRGGDLRITARLTAADGRPLAGREVTIYLGPVGMTEPGAAVTLGTVQTGRDGRARARVKVPREQTIGRWSLFVRFSGDDELRPAIAE